MKVRRTCPDCGYTADYATAALATAHHRRHSCAKHRRGLEQARRRAERLQARVTRQCTHPQARHRHGTRAAYVRDRCRCPDCTAANTAASHTATRERIYGRWQPYLDAGPSASTSPLYVEAELLDFAGEASGIGLRVVAPGEEVDPEFFVGRLPGQDVPGDHEHGVSHGDDGLGFTAAAQSAPEAFGTARPDSCCECGWRPRLGFRRSGLVQRPLMAGVP
jgi:hypothetical protein